MNINAVIYAISIGFASAIALLHLFLYLFYPRERANLFFSIFAFGVAARQFSSDLLQFANYDSNFVIPISLAKGFSLALAIFAFVLFLYAAFSRPIARHFWIALAVWILLALFLRVFRPVGGFDYSGLLLGCFVLIESSWLLIRAFIERKDGAWIIGLGAILLGLAPLKDLFYILTYSPFSSFWNTLINQIAVCGIIVANSVFLARHFARTNKNLEAQLVQVKELSERELEHERTAAELRLQNEQERARLALVEQELALAANIQQELFPKKMPDIAGYE